MPNPAEVRRSGHLRSIMCAIAATVVPVVACEPIPSANLADLVRAGDPVPIIESLIKLGHTIDLSKPSQVRAAIGNVQGAKVRENPAHRAGDVVFTGYGFPAGEITYNRESPDVLYLSVSFKSCVVAQLIRDRLREPEFNQRTLRINIAIYTNVFYANRPLTSFAYHGNDDSCVTSIGLTQWKHDPWHNH